MLLRVQVRQLEFLQIVLFRGYSCANKPPKELIKNTSHKKIFLLQTENKHNEIQKQQYKEEYITFVFILSNISL